MMNDKMTKWPQRLKILRVGNRPQRIYSWSQILDLLSKQLAIDTSLLGSRYWSAHQASYVLLLHHLRLNLNLLLICWVHLDFLLKVLKLIRVQNLILLCHSLPMHWDNPLMRIRNLLRFKSTISFGNFKNLLIQSNLLIGLSVGFLMIWV